MTKKKQYPGGVNLTAKTARTLAIQEFGTARGLTKRRCAVRVLRRLKGGDSMKRQFCLPCFLEIKKAGKHDIERVRGGVNMKITCWRCKRRRFGAEYEISRKGGASRDNG